MFKSFATLDLLSQGRAEMVVGRGSFADHAAEFWLTIGGDPGQAPRLARQNFALRQTPRARALVRRATGCLAPEAWSQRATGSDSGEP